MLFSTSDLKTFAQVKFYLLGKNSHAAIEWLTLVKLDLSLS